MFSPTYVSTLVVLLSQFLPMIGVEVGSEDLTTTISTVSTIGAALVILVRRFWKGDVTIFGRHR